MMQTLARYVYTLRIFDLKRLFPLLKCLIARSLFRPSPSHLKTKYQHRKTEDLSIHIHIHGHMKINAKAENMIPLAKLNISTYIVHQGIGHSSFISRHLLKLDQTRPSFLNHRLGITTSV